MWQEQAQTPISLLKTRYSLQVKSNQLLQLLLLNSWEN
nr:MAG TPA: hypothetical protein [Caudoviricetes sp.]DAK80262.1 MAG TPA: hypothetical protein [Caudoviricetes sp.]